MSMCGMAWMWDREAKHANIPQVSPVSVHTAGGRIPLLEESTPFQPGGAGLEQCRGEWPAKEGPHSR